MASLADFVGHGVLATTLAREGLRTRADLLKVMDRLPREAQANVRFNPVRGTPIAEAKRIAAEIAASLTFGTRRLEIIPVGSVRRESTRVKDFDFIVITPRAGEILASAASPMIADTYAAGTRRRGVMIKRGAHYYRCDLFAVLPAEKPFALYHYTGPYQYNIRTRAHAKRKGWRLNQYGLFSSATGRRVRGSSAIKTERDLARFLGVTYRDPHERNAEATLV